MITVVALFDLEDLFQIVSMPAEDPSANHLCTFRLQCSVSFAGPSWRAPRPLQNTWSLSFSCL